MGGCGGTRMEAGTSWEVTSPLIQVRDGGLARGGNCGGGEGWSDSVYMTRGESILNKM